MMAGLWWVLVAARAAAYAPLRPRSAVPLRGAGLALRSQEVDATPAVDEAWPEPQVGRSVGSRLLPRVAPHAESAR